MSNNDFEFSNKFPEVDLSFRENEKINYNSQNEFEICKNCDSKFGDFHARVAHFCKPYKCIFCYERFLYDYQLKMHEIECSGVKETDDKVNSFHCSSCDSTFETSKLLSQHKSLCFTKHSTKKCSVCQEEFEGRICKNCKQKVTENKKQKIKDKNHSLRHSIQNSSNRDSGCEFTTSDDSEQTAEVKKYSLRRIRLQSSQSLGSDVSNSSEKQSPVLLVSAPLKDKCDKPAKDGQMKEKVPYENVRKTRKRDSKQLRMPRFVKTESLDKKMDSETKKKTRKFKVKSSIDKFSNRKVSHSPESKHLLSKSKEVTEKKDDIKKLEDDSKMHCMSESSNSSTSCVSNNKNKTSVLNLFDKTFKAIDLATKVSDFLDSSDGRIFLKDSARTYREYFVSCNRTQMEQEPTDLTTKRKVVDDSDSEKNFSTMDVKSSKQENCKGLFTNTLGTFQQVLKKSDTEMEFSNSESLSTNDETSEQGQNSDKEASATFIALKIRKNKYRRVSNSKMTLIPASKPLPSNFVLDEKNKDSSRPKNVERELEVSNCTLNSIPEDLTESNRLSYYNDKGMGENIGVCPVSRIENQTINLDSILNLLPDETCGFLLKVAATTSDSYRCPKCSKLFKQIKTGSVHYSRCKSARFQKNLQVSLDEIAFICIKCHFHCSQWSELSTHKKSCTQNDISDYILHYQNTNKNHVCKTCGYSCLSFHAFTQHSCDKRLESMKTCVVGVKKLTANDLDDFKNLCKFSCSACDATFFDDATYKMHGQNHESAGIEYAKIHITKGKEIVRKKVEKFVKNSDTFDTVNSLMEKLVLPLSEMNSKADPENKLPDLKMDFTMPYENQKLVEAAAKKFFSVEMFKSFFNKSVEKEMGTDDMGFDASKTQLPENILSQLIDPSCAECRAKRAKLNMVDIKPCKNCLDLFSGKYTKMCLDLAPEKKETIPSNNASKIIMINNNVGGVKLPSFSDRQKVATSASTSSFNTSLPNNSLAPEFSANFSQTSHGTKLKSANHAFEATAEENSELKALQEIVEKIFDGKIKNNVFFTVGAANAVAHCDFDGAVQYSAYIIKATRLLICSSCMASFTAPDLMHHLVDVHKKYDIKIFII